MKTVTFEVAIPVETYLDSEGNEEEAFDDAREDVEGARMAAVDELIDNLDKVNSTFIQINSVTFLEFDSSNVTHAHAYWEVSATMPETIVEILTEEGFWE